MWGQLLLTYISLTMLKVNFSHFFHKTCLCLPAVFYGNVTFVFCSHAHVFLFPLFSPSYTHIHTLTVCSSAQLTRHSNITLPHRNTEKQHLTLHPLSHPNVPPSLFFTIFHLLLSHLSHLKEQKRKKNPHEELYMCAWKYTLLCLSYSYS